MTAATTGVEQRLASLIQTECAGITLTNRAFDSIVSGVRESLLNLAAPLNPLELTVPPVISRTILERAGYVDTFPHLVGTVHSFTGGRDRWREIRQARRDAGTPWHVDQAISDVAVLPSVCCHLYPMLSGQRLTEPVSMTAEAYCYRHETTDEPGRLRSFRMREFVRIAAPDECVAWRDGWVTRAKDWLASLGLEVSVEPASDHFFGDAARVMGRFQREQALKWEFVSDLGDGNRRAIASANYHKDHFSDPFGIRIADGTAHTSCVAFGMERTALALIAAHGADPADWPKQVRARLWPMA